MFDRSKRSSAYVRSNGDMIKALDNLNVEINRANRAEELLLELSNVLDVDHPEIEDVMYQLMGIIRIRIIYLSSRAKDLSNKGIDSDVWKGWTGEK